MGVKDNICTQGIRTTCASKMLADFIPPYTATAVERLYQEGAVLLGKQNMDEFAMGSSSTTSYFGAVHNPYDRTRIAGGSSGGGAAGMALGLAVAALGSDTGGSVRQPAALCGVTGFKPTYGAVSRYGLIAFASSLDQIGILARSAADCAAVLQVIAGKDKGDMTSSGKEPASYTKISLPQKRKPSIAVLSDLLQAADPQIRDQVLSALNWYEKNGCIVEPVSLSSLSLAVPAYYLLSSAEAASNLARYDGVRYGYRASDAGRFEELIEKSRSEGFGPEVKRRILLGNYALCSGYYDKYYRKATAARRELIKELEALFERFDFCISPTVPKMAGKLEDQKKPADIYREDACTVLANLAGLPSVSTTCGYSRDGMPIGMSILGPRFSDGQVLGLADWFEGSFVRKECF